MFEKLLRKIKMMFEKIAAKKEFEALYDAASADGEITEKEREVLRKKAISMGIDPDEFEMLLEARLIEDKKTKEEEAEEAERLNQLKSAGLGLLRASIDKKMGSLDVTAKSGLDQINPQAAAPAQPTPPPMPGAVSYMIAVNGQQCGPYNMQQMQQLAAQGQLTAESLVWCQGMAAWEPAGNRPDLTTLFAPAAPSMPML